MNTILINNGVVDDWWGHIYVNILSYKHRNSHYKDKTDSRPSHLWNGNPNTQKSLSLYWNGSQSVNELISLANISRYSDFVETHKIWLSNQLFGQQIIFSHSTETNHKALPLRWCHNERDGVSNHWGLDCLLSRSKKTSKLLVTGLWVGNPPASNAENISIWWRHNGFVDPEWHGISTQWASNMEVARMTCMDIKWNSFITIDNYLVTHLIFKTCQGEVFIGCCPDISFTQISKNSINWDYGMDK